MRNDQTSATRVMIVDDHSTFRLGLEYLLMSIDDIELVGKADSGEMALRLLEEVQPDVILMDIVLPGIDGVAAIKKVRELMAHVQIVVLTAFEEDLLVQKTVKAGAISYLVKTASGDEIIEAIRMAKIGQPILTAGATRALIGTPDPSLTLGRDLTERQRNVLALIVVGLSNGEIAKTLKISPSSVRHHVSVILTKLNASNRAEAAAKAVQYQLTDVG